MRHRSSFSKDERAARSRLSQLVHGEVFVYGSIVTSRRKCGKETCRCRKTKNGGHISSYLSVRIGKKRKMIFIPKTRVEKVREWTKTYQEINEQLVKISERCVEKIRKG